MCVQCRAKGQDVEWDHWCDKCLGSYPWNHKPASRLRVILRKLWRIITGRFSIRIEWQ